LSYLYFNQKKYFINLKKISFKLKKINFFYFLKIFFLIKIINNIKKKVIEMNLKNRAIFLKSLSEGVDYE